MLILSLKLDNIKSYDSATIDFTEGTNAIVGRNGAGKSTILEAIGFALFGHLPYNQNDFVNEGAKSGTVTVTFVSSVDDRAYDVTRRCGASSTYYVYDPELAGRVCEGKADVTDFLKKHMGVDAGADLPKLFSDAVGVPQGTLTAAFLQTPGPRKSTFDPLLQVAEYADAFNRLREPARLIKEQQQALAVTIADLGARLERLPGLQTQASALADELAQAAAEAKSVAAQLETAQSQRQALEDLRAEVERLRDQRNRSAQSVTNLAESMSAAVQRRDRAASAQATLQKNQPGHDEFMTAQTRKSQLDAQIGQRQRLQQEQSKLDKTLAQIRADLVNVARALTEIAAAEAKMAALAPQVQTQTDLDAAIGEARQQVALFAQIQTTLDAQMAQHARLTQRVAALQAELDQGESLRADLEKTNADLAAAELIVDAQRSARIHRGAEQQTIEQQQLALEQAEGAACPVCEEPLTPDHRAEMLARNAARLAELLREDRAAQTELAAAQKEVKTLTARRKSIEAALQQLPRPQEIDGLTAQMGTLAGEIESLSTQIGQRDEVEAEIVVLIKKLSTLGNPRQEQAISARTAQSRGKAEAQQTQLQTQTAEQEQALAEVTAQVAAFATLDGDLADVAQLLAQHHPAYQAVLANRQLAATLADQSAEVDRLTAAHAAALTAKEEAEDALTAASARFDADAYAEALTQERSLSARQAGLSAQIALQKKELARTQREIDELQKRQTELAAAQASQTKLEGQSALLEAIRNVLRKAGPYITAALVQQISHNAARLFGDIMQDYTRRLLWGQDYGITLEVNGHERAFAQLSGGEQMAAALSVRLALLREMSSIDIAFFDEPTTNLDEARRESLAQQILDVKGFKQLFVISHDDTFEQATENLIRVNKIDGKSVVE
ncbi:MAG: SMC family ATPase [Caldilineaceae bacterium]|nr:SMC family ATPase [Caldilineaceae bacterium]MBP8108633.1 SMC family ATPase [Caldilineaceae bacterium]MBP8123186.1 SMC family ATPase [Caldilineaceae bacterium]MBP9072408.1 SMC family ATPase [Caldilineaceae bacterium]